MRTLFRWTALVVAVLCLVLVPVVAAAQAAAGAIGSGLLSGFAPIATTLLASGLMWVANEGMGLIRSASNGVKYAVYAVIGVVVSVGVGALGGTVSADPSTWSGATAQGIAAAVVGSLIFKLGKGK